MICPRGGANEGSDRDPAGSAPGGSRTPNLLIRSQMLYPLSYRRGDATLPVVVFAPGKANRAFSGCHGDAGGFNYA